MNQKKIFVVIVNWNGYQDTQACLESLLGTDYNIFQIIVIDNGSNDDSLVQIKNNFPQIKIIETGRNLGFAGGNNIGVKYALEYDADYIMLLNSDTIVDKEFLAPLVDFLEDHPSAGSVQPKLLRFSSNQIIDSLGHKITKYIAQDINFGLKDDKSIKNPREIFGPCAAAALYKKEIFEKV